MSQRCPEGDIDGQMGGICFTLKNGPAQAAPSCLKRFGPSIPVVPGTSYKGNRHVYATQTFGGAVLLSRALAILQKTPPTKSSNACSDLRENASSSFNSPRRVRIQVSANQTPATI